MFQNRDLNRASYNNIAAAWDASRREFYGRERDYLDILLEGLPPGCDVLDLGVGTGRPMAEHVLQRGYRVTGVDQAESLLSLARQRFPDATWIHSTIEEFATQTRYHAIICWDALFHIDRSWHEELIARWASMLVSGGRVMMTFGGSNHPAFTDTMFGQRFAYDSYPPEKVLDMLRQNGFETSIAEFMNVPNGGTDKGRYVVVAHKVESIAGRGTP